SVHDLQLTLQLAACTDAPRILGCAAAPCISGTGFGSEQVEGQREDSSAGAELARLYKTLLARHGRENEAGYFAAHRQMGRTVGIPRPAGGSNHGGRVSRPSPSFQLRSGHPCPPPGPSWGWAAAAPHRPPPGTRKRC